MYASFPIAEALSEALGLSNYDRDVCQLDLPARLDRLLGHQLADASQDVVLLFQDVSRHHVQHRRYRAANAC
jgi:hypothetical protein